MTIAYRDLAPAKVNLALHVTGQRADGYHLLSSLVAFADIGDRITVRAANQISLAVTGPRAQGVPADARNLCWKAAEAFGQHVAITLDKQLPAAAGIGGGSSDAATVLRLMERALGPAKTTLEPAKLGADVPVCLTARAAVMEGIGETVTPVFLPRLPAVLVNPGVGVATPAVFKALATKDNPAMAALPNLNEYSEKALLLDWLAEQRNDLETPARALCPAVDTVLGALQPKARLARMSGSGATCFALYDTLEQAKEAAEAITQAYPNWWVAPCTLG